MQQGIDNYSYRRLLRYLESLADGARLASLMLTIAVGAMWTRTRVATETSTNIPTTCLRCGTSDEDDYHRCWECEGNSTNNIIRASNTLCAEAASQRDMFECFWTRGLLPTQWTTLPPPPQHDQWEHVNCNHHEEGCMNHVGGHPIYAFGDASGGPDTAVSPLRRIGIGVAFFADLNKSDMPLRGATWGPLTGSRQTVIRGELMALVVAAESVTDDL
eukprot:9481115-Pyramimonas_sp.AAC.1